MLYHLSYFRFFTPFMNPRPDSLGSRLSRDYQLCYFRFFIPFMNPRPDSLGSRLSRDYHLSYFRFFPFHELTAR